MESEYEKLLLENMLLKQGFESILDYVGRSAPRGSGDSYGTDQAMIVQRNVRKIAKSTLKVVKEL